MPQIKAGKLDCGASYAWATPLGGFGYIADEQPLPFLTANGIELTPRYGGEETLKECQRNSLPLPQGLLATPRPSAQKLFSLYKRRANIYWRNLFKCIPNNGRNFHFLDQLRYKDTINGFLGESPSITFQRIFATNAKGISSSDTITFKKSLKFKSFEIAHFAKFQDQSPSSFRSTSITSSLQPNRSRQIASATGLATLHYHCLTDPRFEPGQKIDYTIKYQIHA